MSDPVECLRAAGWLPNRSIDPKPFEEVLRENQLPVFERASEFFREYGGLTVTWQHPVTKRPVSASFDAGKAIRDFFVQWVPSYADRVGEQLTVIGTAFNNYMLLTMSISGRVFGGYDQELVLVGDSGYQAIERMCSGVKLEVVG